MASRLVVVGAGHAAGQLVDSVRREGWVGEILLVGEEPYLPYQRPPLSKKFLSGDLALERTYFRPPAAYEKNAVDLHLDTQVTAIERDQQRVVTASGEQIEYSALALTTGSRARTIQIPGIDLEGVFYLRSIDDVLKIRAGMRESMNVAILGGGYIGLEVAAVLRSMGHQVTVLEMADRVMARVVAPAISHFYEAEHRAKGVEILTGAAVEAVLGQGQVEGVRCADGTEISADMLIVGVGVVPNVELAQACGLRCDNGICVDAEARTSDPRIVAAGDCTWHPNGHYGHSLRLESVHNAVEQAKAAAATVCGNSKPYNQVPWFWSDQYDLKLQIAGLTTGYDDSVVRGDTDARSFSVFYLRDGRLIASDNVNSPQNFMVTRKLLAEGVTPSTEQLADPDFALKSLL